MPTTWNDTGEKMNRKSISLNKDTTTMRTSKIVSHEDDR